MSHITGAAKAGLKVGVYFFTEAINAKEGREEAEYTLKLIKKAGVKLSYPIAIDTENKIYSKQPSSWMCKGDFTEITKTALRQIEDKAKSDNYTYVNSL